MTSLKENCDVSDEAPKKRSELKEENSSTLPPKGTSLHNRRRGEALAFLSVKTPQTPSDPEGSSPCTALTSEENWSPNEAETDPETFCENMIQRLKDRTDLPSIRGKDLAIKTKETLEILDQFEKLLGLLDQFTSMKQQHGRIMRRLRDVNQLQKMVEARKRMDQENERLIEETKELQLINEALDADLECQFGQVVFDSIMSGRSMKRSGSKWKGHGKFRGSLLKKQRSRSAGGEDSDVSPGTPLRRMSDGLYLKEMEKSKVSKWTKVKAAFRWEKAQWPATMAGASVAAGAMVGVVALAGSSPATPHEPRDSASLTPGSALSLTPNSSSEELRMDSGSCPRKSVIMHCDENDNTFLHAPAQDDSSSPSPNKLHKSPWLKMRDIISTHRDSVKKKHRGAKVSPDVLPSRRRSFSDGADSDAPPALTLTIPSSEELESEPHPVLRKQRSLELGSRPPQHRAPRASKWTKVKKAFLSSASASVPSSPNRHSAFFTDAETEGLSSGCEANGVREEIARDYAALQNRLGREFQDRRGKLYASSRPVATEEQLSADFRKKLAEWQRMKGDRQPPPVPARQDLSEDFLKKWDEWKIMKETNSVPTLEEGAKPEEVLVQTSTGLFKFQGISRSFTRKLHEWEKSRGIAPEASTSALLREARERNKVPPAPLTRTQSDGSVAPLGGGRLHASSLSVNNVDDFESDYEGHRSFEDIDECDGEDARGAVLVEVEDEEVCTAAPLVAMCPRHTPQKPVYTYGRAEARLLCETSSAITGTAVLQPNGTEMRIKSSKESGAKPKSKTEKTRKKIARQPSLEEDAMFIRKTIEEIERCSNRFKEEDERYNDETAEEEKPSTTKAYLRRSSRQDSKESKDKEGDEDNKDEKRKEEKGNGKKKSKSRARLEREQSKPSESDTEQEVDTVTVEIPRRRKRPRRPSERPKTPPTSLHSDTEEEIFVLKLNATEVRDHSPEVIVKTTRKIFSPVIRSGETVPKAVIPVDVDDLDEVRPSRDQSHRSIGRKLVKERSRDSGKGSGDLQDGEERPRSRPPLPLSPSSQRKPQPKETAPSIRIMIQRYNKKITEEGHTSPISSGASSPAWRSPVSERRRPPDMPVGVNIKNNPFVEREVQKSASASQLSRKEQTSSEKRVALTTPQDGVLKSHSAHALHLKNQGSPKLTPKNNYASQETMRTGASTDTITPDLTKNLPENQSSSRQSFGNLPEYQSSSQEHFKTLPGVPGNQKSRQPIGNLPENQSSSRQPLENLREHQSGSRDALRNMLRNQNSSSQVHDPLPVLRQLSESVVPTMARFMSGNPGIFERSISALEGSITSDTDGAVRISERAARIRVARERFLTSSVQMRREGTYSAHDLRPGDRLSRISCDSDTMEIPGSSQESQALNRSASTGMVNVDRESWQRVAEGSGHETRSRSRFSLARLAAKLRRKDDSSGAGAVSRLCRQSLLVQLRNKH